MKLIGYYASPYVRRVGITLKLYGLPFEHLPWATAKDREAIKAYNPTGRVPALVLDSGEVLVDSSIIIDYLDELAGPARALTPPDGPGRRRVMALLGLALAVTDKYVAAFYEVSRRPPSHVWRPWLDHLEGQVSDGLAALEAACMEPYLLGETLTQADLAVIVAVEDMRTDMPHLAPPGRYPKLDRLIARTAVAEPFTSTRYSV